MTKRAFDVTADALEAHLTAVERDDPGDGDPTPRSRGSRRCDSGGP